MTYPAVSQAAIAPKPLLRNRVPGLLLSYLAIGIVALLPRVLNLRGFATVDEVNFWVPRSERFLHLLQTADFGAMVVSDHPGVTTVWLGTVGLGLHRALLNWSVVESARLATKLAVLRLPVVLVNSAGNVLGYWMLRRLLPAPTAALAALLWAADPFILGYSGLLHVDALAMTFIALSLLAVCCYRRDPAKRMSLVLSGVFAGLAILSKSPSLLLGPVAALVIVSTDHSTSGRDSSHRSWLPSSQALWPLVIWGMVCAATVFTCWPALWVDPLIAYRQIRRGVVTEGALPHGGGNFFLGHSEPAPGLLFYPVALALRLTPWAMLGLFLLPLAWRRVKALAPARRDLAVLAAFVVLFVVVMSVFPKKFNRYLLLAFPEVDILAAAGLVWISPTFGAWKRRFAAGATGAIALAALLNAIAFYPYYIVYFNQALGGPKAGADALMIGWGEGMDQVAMWLNAQPDITGVLTVSTQPDPLQPYMRRGAQVAVLRELVLPAQTGYVVVYVRDVQDGVVQPPFDRFYGHVPPAHTVSLYGVAYAWIYQVPPPVPQPRQADFGDAIRLRGFGLHDTDTPGRSVDIKLFWEVRADLTRNYTLFMHVVGPGGRRYVQLNLLYSTSTWLVHRFQTTDVPLVLPATAPPGQYHVIVGLYDSVTGARLPLRSADATDPAFDGPDALMLTRLELK
jgi:4-amino-4-deoxy-L-arabinose transferase-like glycosyltransferase